MEGEISHHVIKEIHDIPIGQSGQIDHRVGSLPSGNIIHTRIHVFKGLKKGPSLLLLAGMHGDEINGIEILRRSITNGMFVNIQRGTVIVAPLLNLFGFINYSRDLPDGKDINRSFPGSANGSLASRLAWHITQHILPESDLIIDFHTGGAARYNYPQIRYSEEIPESKDLAQIFGATFIVHKPVIEKSLRAVGTAMGKPVIVFEGGETLRYDQTSISQGIEGIRRVLAHYQMIKGSVPEIHSKIIRESTWIRAQAPGLFLWSKSAGTKVSKGEVIGDIHDPHGHMHHEVTAPRNGYLLGLNNAAVINLGDALFHIGWED